MTIDDVYDKLYEFELKNARKPTCIKLNHNLWAELRSQFPLSFPLDYNRLLGLPVTVSESYNNLEVG